MKPEMLYRELLLVAIKEHERRKIGEGNYSHVLNKFEGPLCFKVGKPGDGVTFREFQIQEKLFKLNLPVPEPYAYLDNAIAMNRIDGVNLEQAWKEKKWKMSDDVKEQVIDAIEEVTRVIEHNDLALRNIMIGNVEIEDGIVVEADVYVIDFGKSVIKPALGPSREGEAFIAQIKRLF